MVTRLHPSNVKVRISPSSRRMDTPIEVPRTIDIAFQCLSMIGESGFYVRRNTIDSLSLSSR